MSLVVTSVADSTEPADPMQQSFYTFIVSQASSWLIQKFIVLLGLSHPSLLSSQQMALPSKSDTNSLFPDQKEGFCCSPSLTFNNVGLNSDVVQNVRLPWTVAPEVTYEAAGAICHPFPTPLCSSSPSLRNWTSQKLACIPVQELCLGTALQQNKYTA